MTGLEKIQLLRVLCAQNYLVKRIGISVARRELLGFR